MKIKKGVKIIGAFVAVIFGLLAIFKIVLSTEIAVGFITISFGVLAVIWTSTAYKSLSKGSALKRHTGNFLLCLVFILLFAIWHTLSVLFEWRKTLNEILLYPGYAFITFAFLIFVISSYQVLMMGKEFGFGEQALKIEKRIKEKTKLKKLKTK